MQKTNRHVCSSYLRKFNMPFSRRNKSKQLPSNIPLTAKKNLVPESQETYRDLSMLSEQDVLNNLNYTSMIGRPKDPFPVKLHSLLECSESGGYASIISWLPHGRAFKIHDEKLFIEKIIPHFFFQSKMSSFQRQLRMCKLKYCNFVIYSLLFYICMSLDGFHKISHKAEVDQGAYFNEFFLRTRPGLSRGIMRLKRPCPLYQVKDPNLYLHPPMPVSWKSNASMKAQGTSNDRPRIIQYSKPVAEETAMISHISSKHVPEQRSLKMSFLPFSASFKGSVRRMYGMEK